MTRDRQANVADQNGRGGRARFNPWLVVVFILLGCVVLLAFEEGLNLAALSLFPHHDTADCAVKAITRAAPIQHAHGYSQFVMLAESFGTNPRAFFDLWTFAHFIRAHREALHADSHLLRAAVIFLGNVLITRYPECFWSAHPRMLFGETERGACTEIAPGQWREEGERRTLWVGGTVPAILAADERRFRAFQSVVDGWTLSNDAA